MTLIFATWFLVWGMQQAILRAKPAGHPPRQACSRPDQMRGKEGRPRWKRKAREGKERTHEANTESIKRLEEAIAENKNPSVFVCAEVSYADGPLT